MSQVKIILKIHMIKP